MMRKIIAFICWLIAVTLLLLSAPCWATQTINNSINASTESGTQLATDLNNSFTSLISTNRGSSRPSYAVAGMLWANNVSGTLENLFVYDGNSDLSLGSYNPTTHVFTLPNSLPADATLSGNPTTTTQTAGNSSTRVATTAFVNGTALTLATGTTAITQSANDNSTKVATTAYVDAGGSAGMTLLATVNASGASSVVFGSSVITSAYNKYEIQFDSVYLSGANSLLFEYSASNGSTWLTGNQLWKAVVVVSTVVFGGSSLTDPPLDAGQFVSSTSSQPCQGHVTFSKPSLAAFQNMEWKMQCQYFVDGVSTYTSATAMNAVRFISNSGATITGNFHLYGLKGT